jgi:hypothetical protein
LHNFSKDQSCQGLLLDSCRRREHPKNSNYHAIWLILVFVYFFWAVQRRTDFSPVNVDRTTDGPEGLFAYMDNSRVGSPNRQTHLIHLKAFFAALATNSLAINLKKCDFAAPLWNFLVAQFRQQVWPPWPSILPQSKLVPPLRISNPKDIKQLQRYLGLVNFYCCFLLNCAKVLHPLKDLLKGSPKTLEWTNAAQEALQNAKCLLTVAVPVQHPSPQAELSLATIALDSHIGGIMQQKSGNQMTTSWFLYKKIY